MRLLPFATLVIASTAMSQPPQRMNNGGLPVASPDGRWIAFQSNRDGTPDLYLVGVDGNGLKRITTGPDREGLAGWSPDGKEVFYTITSAGGNMMTPGFTTRLVATSIEAGTTRELGELPGRGAATSRNARLVAWSGGRPQASSGVISRLDGSAPTTFTDTTRNAAFNFAWSPDDRLVAYTSMSLPMGPGSSLSIWTVKSDGTGARHLATIDTANGSAQWPAWSPDGKRIAVQVGKYDRNDPTKNTSHIWLIDVATGASRKIAAHDRPYLDETPSWVDNDTIAVQSDRSARMEIWVMKADGSSARQITR